MTTMKFSRNPKKDLSVDVDLHSFRLTEKPAPNSARLGEELDVTFAYKYSKQATIVFGGSCVFKKQELSDFGRLSDDTKWGYVMTNVAF